MISRRMAWLIAIGIALFLYFGEIQGTRLSDGPAPPAAVATTGAVG